MNLPLRTRIDRLEAHITDLEGQIASGQAVAGTRGLLRQLYRRKHWYLAHTQPVTGDARTYSLPQRRRARVAQVPPELVLDVRSL